MTGGKRQAASGKRQAASGKRQAASGKRPAASGQRPTANGQRPTANGQRPTANGQRPTANGQRPTANGQRPTANGRGHAPEPTVRRQPAQVRRGARLPPPRSIFPLPFRCEPFCTMTEIVTITPNPAVDVATSVDRVTDTRKLRCGPARRDPGGGGINVARVLTRLGADCAALYLAGGDTGRALRGLLADERMRASGVDVADETRENFSVLETSTGREFRFVLPGPTLAPDEWPSCIDALARLADASRFLVMSGSLPPGMPDDCYARLARLANARGARTVVDTSGPALAAALDAGVYLVKPSLGELRALTGLPLDDDAERLAAARAIVGSGRAQIVALTLGDAGALVVSRDDAVRLPGARVAVRSAIGAGDSFVAGLVDALNRGASVADASRYALAAASASLLSAGTALCTKDDVERIYRELPGTVEA
ncbi:hexose kinase [Burkholderia oklahomensis]|nr:hexose kinase [Burkholderia oklahomensis]